MDNCQQVKQIYTYDELNRLTSVTYDDGRRLVYRYDEAGNMLSVAAGNRETLEVTRSVAERTVQRFCSACGYKLKTSAKFCSACGKPV
jgi:YD repeat-containing protein